MLNKYDPGRFKLQHMHDDTVITIEFSGGCDLTELFQMYKQFAQACGYFMQGDLVVDEYESTEEIRLRRIIEELREEIAERKRAQSLDNAFKELADSDDCRDSSCCNCK